MPPLWLEGDSPGIGGHWSFICPSFFTWSVRPDLYKELTGVKGHRIIQMFSPSKCAQKVMPWMPKWCPNVLSVSCPVESEEVNGFPSGDGKDKSLLWKERLDCSQVSRVSSSPSGSQRHTMKTRNRALRTRRNLSEVSSEFRMPRVGVPKLFLWKKNWLKKNSMSFMANGECGQVAESSLHQGKGPFTSPHPCRHINQNFPLLL